MRALLPDNEEERLAALYRYGVLDTQPERSFDRLTRLAARSFCAPVSTITLIDKERQFFKSRHGTDSDAAPLEYSFCAHAILSSEVTAVNDLTADARFADNPLVLNHPGVRWYVGAPLISPDGFRLGTICVADTATRPLPDRRQIEVLKDLADETVELMEFQRLKLELAASQRQSDRRHQRALLALEAGNMGYWERDAETDLITFSPRLEELLGLDHERYDGSVAAWLERVHPDDRKLILDRIDEALRSETNYTFKYRPLTKDGNERWITTTGTYRKDERGKFAGAHGVSWDSTAADVAARELRMSEQLFRVLSDAAPIGIFRTGLSSRMTYVNPTYAAYHGVPEEQLLAHGWMEFLHPEDKDRILSAVKAGRERSCEYEHRLLLRDGTVRWVHVKTSVLRDQDGVFAGKVGTVDDITEQRQMVEDLQNSKEAAEVANRAKDMFLANVSHELRTPLNGVLGMSDLLLLTGLNKEQLEMAQIVRDSARGLLSVVNDMLDLSRIEAGRLAIDRAPFHLRTTIQQTVSMFKADAKAKGISLVTTIAGHLPESYVGDSGRIRQILTNYLSNAMKFTEGGEVAIQTYGEVKDGVAEVVIAVRDHGIGIETEAVKKLFRPFSQVDASNTRRHGGVGLGLAICKRLAELMQGEVGVKSVPGEGSTFWVRVPLTCHEQTANTFPPPVLNHAEAGGSRILVVEDNAVNQKVALGVLRRLGWDADVANNGLVAIDLYKTNEYAVILMDCQMPEMDGYAATRSIRCWEKSVGRRPVPIVALTAHAMNGDRERCLEAGMNDHLAKPVGLEELRAALGRWAMAGVSGD